MAKQAVLLLAHGTPDTVEEIPEYLRNVVSGRPMPEHVIEEIKHRYTLIGHSPLTEISMEQGKMVEAELAMEGVDAQVYVGMRNWKPYIPDVVRKLCADGVEEVAVVCLAPQNSRTSVGLYRRAVQAESGSLKIDFTEGWADNPLLADAFAVRLREAQEKLTPEAGGPVPVLFTAHSVPCRTVQTPAANEGQPRHWPGERADPYAQEAKHTAELVAARVPQIPKWWFAFQSQGASGGPWIGPTVEDTLTSIASEGVKTVLLQPIGFLCDHVEILYDVDIAFKDYAKGLGIRLERPQSLNASLTLARAIAGLAMRGLGRLQENESAARLN
ncbi:MAG: ferrochelatase [Acidobacteria bacterium]|nr:ferrochelatase [Acidobacteriota bacterium]